jgi:hypothetical protein
MKERKMGRAERRRVQTQISSDKSLDELVESAVKRAIEAANKVFHAAKNELQITPQDYKTALDMIFYIIGKEAIETLRFRGIHPDAILPLVEIVIARARKEFDERWRELASGTVVGSA